MLTQYLKAKIHRATVTDSNLEYEGSITIDEDLLDAAGIMRFEKVLIANLANGARIESYAIPGKRGSGVICMNGAAAHRANIGDQVIVMSFCALTPEEAEKHEPRIVRVGKGNRMIDYVNV